MIFDIIAGTGTSSPPFDCAGWTPAELFKNSEAGFWFDATDMTTMSQDNAGTIPVTAIGQTVGTWRNKITNQHLAYTLTNQFEVQRPLLASNSGDLVLRFDGANDILVSTYATTILSGGFTVAVGQKKSSLQNLALLNIADNAGVVLSNTETGEIKLTVDGSSVLTSVAKISSTSHNTILATGTSGASANVIRVNGVPTTGGSTTATQLAGVNSVPGNSSTNGCDISQVVFINRVLTATEITYLEAFIDGLCG